ncbi:MAG: RnfABCDGE type electron transport complex subunit B [Emcibacter sp.]|nr:RnfABCDGE type electron transport complex subunit B [Emcibacter sp.]
MLEAVVSLTALGVGLGAVLGLAARYLKVEGNPLVEEIEQMMPGTQCGQCGYPGCAPAAEGLVKGEAEVTLCPPGGKSLAAALADKLGVELDLSKMEDKEKALAFVNEDLCIGCTRCFQVCPTDSLLGAPQQIHTVISDICTSCEDCIEMCPTGALSMVTIEKTVQTWHWPKPENLFQEVNQ